MNTLKDLIRAMKKHGVTRLYAKHLAANDNSKNQVVLGSDLSLINRIPAEPISTDKVRSTSKKQGDVVQYIFKARVRWSWLTADGALADAPGAQLILYPQYPEIRFSGFLIGCSDAPSELMKSREEGRVLFFGVTERGTVVGHVVAAQSPVAKQVREQPRVEERGVLFEIQLTATDPREQLLAELRRIAAKGWIHSKKLVSEDKWTPCNNPNCGGYTLEAELGIRPNGIAEPDFNGWEVKQHGVNSFDRLNVGILTLMTPEPTDGYYKTAGPEAFVRKFGYADKRGRVGRHNFGGLHRFQRRIDATGLTLRLYGFAHEKGRITDPRGSLVLETDEGDVAAAWSFEGLMKHWQKKHAQAAYVPSMKRESSIREYRFGPVVRLGEGTDFGMFLRAVACGSVYYDPGIKLETVNRKEKLKRRSQFRVKSSDLPALYRTMETVRL
jgi:hypothetical protein